MEYGLVAIWLSLFLAVLAGAMPLASLLFPRLADRGAGVAVPLALSVVWLVAYGVGHASLSLALVAGFLTFIALVGLAIRHGGTFDVAAYKETALVFAVAFCFMVAIRAVDPGVHPSGGEKFLDYGLLKSVLRADALAPEDFWYAGEDLMYYYGGHLLVALLSRLTATAPNFAYNLALPAFYAMFVTAAYGLAGSIAGRRGSFGRGAGVLAAFFVAFASNLMTPLRLLLAPLPVDVARPLAKGLGVWTGRTGSEGNVVTGVQSFASWDASGVIPGTINEFPLFAWVNGDLHGHMMSPPFTLLLVALLYSYYRTPADARTRRLALVFGAVPLVGALLSVFNTWSFAAVPGLTFLTLLLAPTSPVSLLGSRFESAPESPLRKEIGRFLWSGIAAVVVSLLGILWSLPFWLANGGGRTIAFLPDRSPLPKLFVVHGLFLLPIAVFLAYVAWVRYDPTRRQVATIGGVLVAGLALSAVAHAGVLGLLLPVLVGGYVLGRDRIPESDGVPDGSETATAANGGTSQRPRWPGYELVLVLAGAGLVLAVEFVYLEENAGPGRFNTVFKTYAQVWTFWSVAAAVAFARLLRSRHYRVPTPRWDTLLRTSLVLLVVGTSCYGVFSLAGHFSGSGALQATDDPTLDGTAFVEDRHPDEAEAIAWLDDRDGTPTIVTKPGTGGELYDWTNAPSSLTGVPTIIGWAHHEKGFGRPTDAVDERVEHVDLMYTASPLVQRQLLDRYDVEYVYVGPRERENYGTITITERDYVTVEREWGDVTIYRVEQDTSA